MVKNSLSVQKVPCPPRHSGDLSLALRQHVSLCGVIPQEHPYGTKMHGRHGDTGEVSDGMICKHGLPNPLSKKLTGKDGTFIAGNFRRLQRHLWEQHPERFGCGNLGAGRGEQEVWERQVQGGKAFADIWTISNPAYKVMHWLIQVQEPCTGNIYNLSLNPLSVLTASVLFCRIWNYLSVKAEKKIEFPCNYS